MKFKIEIKLSYRNFKKFSVHLNLWADIPTVRKVSRMVSALPK